MPILDCTTYTSKAGSNISVINNTLYLALTYDYIFMIFYSFFLIGQR